MTIKFAFSSNAFRNYTIEESISSIFLSGYSGIEIMCDEPHAFPPLSEKKINSIKNTLVKKNLEISNLNGFMMCAIQDFHHPSWIEKNQKFRQIRIDHTKNCLNLAKRLGAKTVSTEPGGLKNEFSENEALDSFEKGLNEVLPIAEKNKVKLLIEPEPDLLIENSSQFLKFISRFDSKNIGLNFDVGHFFCVGEEPHNVIKLLQDYVSHIHLEDISKERIHKHLIPGEGIIDFRKLFDAIDDINYKGFVTIELYPYQDKPQEAAKKALDYVNLCTK